MHTLHVCTIHPGELGPYSKLNFEILKLIEDKVNIVENFVHCIEPFSKGTGDDSIQIKYRNQYLDRIKIGEFFIILDTDDQLTGNVEYIPELLDMMEKFNRQVAHLGAISYDYVDAGILSVPRILRKTGDLKYEGRHDVMINEHGENITSRDYKKIIECYPIIIAHHKKKPMYLKPPFSPKKQ